MSNQRFFQDRLLSFPTNVPKKNRINSFLEQIIIKSKRSLSDLKIFSPKAIDLFYFQIFFETTKSYVLFLEICELNQNILVLFQSFWIK